LETQKAKIIALAGAFICFLIGFYIFYSNNISVATAINMQVGIFKTMFGQRIGFLDLIVNAFLGLVFLVLGLSFMTALGLFDDDWKYGVYVSVAASLIGGFFFNFSLVFLSLAVCLIIFSAYSVSMSSAFYQELKKWNDIRIGSKVIGKAFSWITLVLAVSIIFVIYADPSYKENFRTTLTDTFTEVMKQQLIDICVTNLEGSEEAQGVDLRSECERVIAESDVNTAIAEQLSFFDQIIEFLPFVIGFSVWAFLGFSHMFLTVIAGVATYLIIRLFTEKSASSTRTGRTR